MPTEFRTGLWRLADPKISLASVASMGLGAAAAASAGPLSPGWLLVTVAGILAVETAKNASGEVFDWDSGTDQRVRAEDRSPFSGGKRVLVDAVLSRRQTWAIAIGGYLIAMAAGVAILAWREPAVFWFGVAGLALAFGYHAPPARLSYRGLGEVAVGIAYGPLICGGTYLVQRGDLPAQVLWLAVPLGLLIAAFLWINEFPDWAADAASGKRTLVVRLGRERAARGFVALGLSAAVVTALLPAIGLPQAAWCSLVAAIRFVPAARTLLAHPDDTARLVPAQAMALQAFLLYALGASAGVLLG